MSDRLALANAIEDAGMRQGGAWRLDDLQRHPRNSTMTRNREEVR